MEKYKHIIVISLLTASAVLAGLGMVFYVLEHVWLVILMIFCLVCALAVENKM